MKSQTVSIKRMRGFALLEALVALIILAVGILSLAKFNTYLLSVGGIAKARAEAVALGNEKIATLRNSVIQSQFSGNVTASDTVAGTNASFNRQWTITDAGTGGPRKQVVVAVSWVDRFGKTQNVTVQTLVSWLDPAEGFSFAGTTSGSQGGKFATSPTGQATIGSGKFSSDPGGTTDGTTGLKVYDDGTNLTLFDPNSLNKLLVMPRTFGGFSTVTGYVYSEMKNTSTAQFDLSNAYTIISDAAYCWKGSIGFYSSSGGTKKASRFEYKCYLGAQWYGNVSVVWVGTGTGPFSCIGDPAVTYSATAYNNYSSSAQPALTGTRRYRGYQLLSGSTVAQTGTTPTSNIYQATGIGVDPNNLATYLPMQYIQQDFWLVKTNPSDGAGCATTMAASIPLASTDPVNPFKSTKVGQYVCLSAPDNNPTPSSTVSPPWSPVYCPNPLPSVSSATLDSVLIQLTIQEPVGLGSSVLSGVADTSGTGFSCTVASAYNSGTGHETYSCALSLNGYIGSQWETVLSPTIQGSNVLCATPSSGNGVVDANAGTITFSNQSVGTTTQAQSITIAASGACP